MDDSTIGVVNSEAAWGWGVAWNSTTVPNGTYTLQSIASALGDNNGASTLITITVNNPLPTTSVLVPSNGATVSGSSVVLDASGSPNPSVTNVSFYLSGSPSFSYPILIGSVTAESYYGWATTWNSAAITDGDYTVNDGTWYLESVAAYSGGTSGVSSPITITIDNPPVTLIPNNNVTVSGTVLLDMSVPPGTTYAEWFLGLNGIYQSSLLASPSPYGSYLEWDTTTVSNGTYTLEPVVVVGSDILNGAFITVNVNNASPS